MLRVLHGGGENGEKVVNMIPHNRVGLQDRVDLEPDVYHLANRLRVVL